MEEPSMSKHQITCSCEACSKAQHRRDVEEIVFWFFAGLGIVFIALLIFA
jgi:hypothetical protein